MMRESSGNGSGADLVGNKPFQCAWKVHDTLDTIGARLAAVATLIGSRDELDKEALRGAYLLLDLMAEEASQVVSQSRAGEDQVAVPMAVLALLAEAAEPRITEHHESIQAVPDQAPLEARILARRAVVASQMTAAWKAARGPKGDQAVMPSFFVEALIQTAGIPRGQA